MGHSNLRHHFSVWIGLLRTLQDVEQNHAVWKSSHTQKKTSSASNKTAWKEAKTSSYERGGENISGSFHHSLNGF